MQNAVIVVKCWDCGETRVAASEVTIRRCVDDGSWSYRFTCPKCRRLSVAPTHEPVASAAMAAGSGFEEWQLPTDLADRPDGPPFTEDDLVELRNRFLDPDWFDALLQRGNDQR
jgi:hypothetical protein